jgi:hypothetical protein
MARLDCAPVTLGRRADTRAAVTLTAHWLERHVFVSPAPPGAARAPARAVTERSGSPDRGVSERDGVEPHTEG